MRQMIFQVPPGTGTRVLEEARAQGGRNLACLEARGPDGPQEMVVVHVANDRVETLLDRLEAIPSLQVTLVPRGVLALHPPADEASGQVRDVAFRSPVEIFLGGLQSVGSWRGFLGYAVASGVVAWVGLLTNTIFLLTAAMLIAPFAAPAMNLAVATARGDRALLGRTLGRYFASLAAAVAVAWVLSWLFGLEVATAQMKEISRISATAALLPLVAGAAGALNLVQSERSSLVSSAATGVLVAASLAPPAALLGMASAIGQWELAKSSLFLLLLQLAGINLAASVVLRLAGLSPRGARYDRGQPWLSWTSWLTTLAVVGMLLGWQFSTAPEFQRASLARQAEAAIQSAVRDEPRVELVDAEARFTRADLAGRESLLALVYVRDRADDPALERRVDAAIRREFRARRFPASPLLQVVVLRGE